jgi:hydroxymethylpyrimidine/phosphomethylpyrimidine kinase
MTAITAVTAQNTQTVSRVLALPPDMVTAQIEAVLADIPPDATKIGMLATSGIVEAVASALSRHHLRNVVLDTVMVAKGGARLLDDGAVAILRERLLPLATVVTPNVPEAEALTGLSIRTTADLERAAVRLVELGARAALVKGGHLSGPAVDVLHDGQTTIQLSAPRLDTRHTHGTGCTLSSAIAARLALGDDLESACRAAKSYVTEAILRAPGLGKGHGPLG